MINEEFYVSNLASILVMGTKCKVNVTKSYIAFHGDKKNNKAIQWINAVNLSNRT